MLRAIREIKPRFVVGENVRGLVNWNGGMVFDEVQADLEAEGYEVTPYILPACAVNAPHRRDRVWFVAVNTKCNTSGRNYSGESSGIRMDMESDTLGTTGRKQGSDKPNTSSSNGNASNTENNGSPRQSRRSRVRFRRWILSREFKAGSELVRGCKTFTYSTDTRTEDLRREREDAIHGVEVVADAKSKFSNDREHREHSQEGKIQQQIRRSNSIVTDTNGIGLRNEVNRFGEPGFFNETGERNDWSNFPTQPPICTGDDGISDESLRSRIRDAFRRTGLEITERQIEKTIKGIRNKWREETIKAAGNAIVPQVALMIFKAIEQTEKQKVA
jgi:DNA (cytosine-5)-methyltransferase 1